MFRTAYFGKQIQTRSLAASLKGYVPHLRMMDLKIGNRYQITRIILSGRSKVNIGYNDLLKATTKKERGIGKLAANKGFR